MMNGYEYEKWCAEWLKRQGYRSVRITKASHDQGIDIIAFRHHRKTGFQCKYYDMPVSNQAVQQAYAGAAYYGCDSSAVITNSVFTKSAIEAAAKLEVSLYSQIQPETPSRFLRVRRIFSVFLFAAGILLFLFSAFQSSFPFRMNYAVISILVCFSSLCTLASDSLLTMNILPILLCIYPLVFFFTRMSILQQALASAPLLLEIVFCLIGTISLMKKRNLLQSQREKEELQQKIEEGTKALGKTIVRLLEESLQAKLTIRESFFENNECVFTCHADQNIADDLPLAVYDLNQMYSDQHYYLEYEVLNNRLFRIRFLQIRNQ